MEFWVPKGSKPQKGMPGNINSLELRSKRDGAYKALGRVVYTTDKWIVIDFGILAYAQKDLLPELNIGDTIQSRICFGIDPFHYFEQISKRTVAPPLIYDWYIDSIAMETAPFVFDGALQVRDPNKLKWREVSKTNAWKHDDGKAEYMLSCELLAAEARRRLR